VWAERRKQWRHDSWSTTRPISTPIPIPALWLAAASCDLAEKWTCLFLVAVASQLHRNYCLHEIVRDCKRSHGYRIRIAVAVNTTNATHPFRVWVTKIFRHASSVVWIFLGCPCLVILIQGHVTRASFWRQTLARVTWWSLGMTACDLEKSIHAFLFVCIKISWICLPRYAVCNVCTSWNDLWGHSIKVIANVGIRRWSIMSCSASVVYVSISYRFRDVVSSSWNMTYVTVSDPLCTVTFDSRMSGSHTIQRRRQKGFKGSTNTI